jgi:hypothetical protein
MGVFGGGRGWKRVNPSKFQDPFPSPHFHQTLSFCMSEGIKYTKLLLHEFLNWSFMPREEHVEDIGFAGSHSGTVLWDAINIVRYKFLYRHLCRIYCLRLLFCSLLICVIILPWRWSQYVSQKCRPISTRLQGITSQSEDVWERNTDEEISNKETESNN